MPKFTKSIEELSSRFDKWLYILRNLNRLDNIPEKLRENIFEQLFETAEIAKFNSQQLNHYEDSLKYYRDLKNSLDTAYEDGIDDGIKKGIEQGIEQGIEKKETSFVMRLYNKGMTVEEIIDLTELSNDRIKQIINSTI